MLLAVLRAVSDEQSIFDQVRSKEIRSKADNAEI